MAGVFATDLYIVEGHTPSGIDVQTNGVVCDESSAMMLDGQVIFGAIVATMMLMIMLAHA